MHFLHPTRGSCNAQPTALVYKILYQHLGGSTSSAPLQLLLPPHRCQESPINDPRIAQQPPGTETAPLPSFIPAAQPLTRTCQRAHSSQATARGTVDTVSHALAVGPAELNHTTRMEVTVASPSPVGLFTGDFCGPNSTPSQSPGALLSMPQCHTDLAFPFSRHSQVYGDIFPACLSLMVFRPHCPG